MGATQSTGGVLPLLCARDLSSLAMKSKGKGLPAGTGPKGQVLSKLLIKKGDTTATVAILMALADDPAFQELAKAEAEQGHHGLAKMLVDGFKLASPSPTAEEITLSLATSLEKAIAEDAAKEAAKAAATNGKMGAGKLTKPLILQKDAASDKALIGVYGGMGEFKKLARSECVVLMGRWRAARRVVEQFKLASPNPSPKECLVSIQSTAAKLAAEAALPSPPPPLSKALIKAGGKPAEAAILATFAKHAGFQKVAMSAWGDEAFAEVSKWYQAASKEPLTKAGERMAARRLAESFKLASPSPTDKEVKLSLGTTLTQLAALL